jgi:hypothetical protein
MQWLTGLGTLVAAPVWKFAREEGSCFEVSSARYFLSFTSLWA